MDLNINLKDDVKFTKNPARSLIGPMIQNSPPDCLTKLH